MLNTHMMQEIIDLKLQGFTPSGIRDYYEAQGIKPPSMPTIRKYFGMDVLPDNPGEKLEKPKVFDVEPFRSEIIKVLESNRDNSKLCISSAMKPFRATSRRCAITCTFSKSTAS